MENQFTFNTEVTTLLDNLNLPLRAEIDQLRQLVLTADTRLAENIKWNGPNYSIDQEDRITMRVQQSKMVQLIFHRGAKVKVQPADKLIQDASSLLTWKENDRAVATFKNMTEIEANRSDLIILIQDWIRAAAV